MEKNITPNLDTEFDVNDIFKKDNESTEEEKTPSLETDSSTEPEKEPVVGDPETNKGDPNGFIKEEPAPADRKVPTKMEGETDENYQLRLRLRELKIARDEASSEEEKGFFIDKIKDTKKVLAKNAVEAKKQDSLLVEEDDAEQIRKNLSQLGFKTEQETSDLIEQKLAEIRGEEIAKQQIGALNQFYTQRPELAKNPEVRDWIENYVLSEYKVDHTTSPKKIIEYFTNTANIYFPKQQIKVSDSSKTSLTDISSSAKPDNSSNKAPAKDVDFLRSQGWSDNDISSLY